MRKPLTHISMYMKTHKMFSNETEYVYIYTCKLHTPYGPLGYSCINEKICQKSRVTTYCPFYNNIGWRDYKNNPLHFSHITM